MPFGSVDLPTVSCVTPLGSVGLPTVSLNCPPPDAGGGAAGAAGAGAGVGAGAGFSPASEVVDCLGILRLGAADIAESTASASVNPDS